MPGRACAQFNEFAYAVMQRRGLLRFIQTRVTPASFAWNEGAENEALETTATAWREQSASEVMEWREKLNEAMEKRTPGWRDLSERTRMQAERTSPLFLRRCTYYMMSPHVNPSGARNKVVKVLRPRTHYEKARRDETKAAKEETSIYSSLQKIVSMR